MTRSAYSLGISPCPNDTYIFEALIHGRSPASFDVNLFMADVEELNTLARQGRLEVTKLSMAAAAHVIYTKYFFILLYFFKRD